MKARKNLFIGIAIIISFSLFIFLLVPLFSKKSAKERSDLLLCASYPVYVIVQNLTQNLPVDVDFLAVGEGGCAHDYVLTPNDRLKMERAKVVIRVGSGMDDYLLDGLEDREEVSIIDCSQGIDSVDYLYYADSHAVDSHAKTEEDCQDQGDCQSVNPHFFVSPTQFLKMSLVVFSELSAVFEERFSHEELDLLAFNFNRWEGQLEELMLAVQQLNPTTSGLKILTQHSAFDYFARDLGIVIVDVLQGGENNELSSGQILYWIGLIETEGVGVLFNEPGYSDRLAKMLVKETGIAYSILDPVTNGKKNAPLDDYLIRMRNNLEIIQSLVVQND